MSGEFRWVSSSYFHSALAEAVDAEAESHAVSKAMSKLYRALAPIERGCAWFEAGDSGSYYPTLSLIRSIGDVKAAVAELTRLASEAEDLVEAALRERDKARGEQVQP